MIVLIPLIQFAVYYELVGGRPYSRFEQLVLKAIYNGLGTLGELEKEFQIHSRLIIEALVTLTQAGWVAVGERGFSLTVQGQRALDSGEVPDARVREDKIGWILMERLTGGLVSNTRATFVSDAELKELGKWESSLRLSPRVHHQDIDEGQVQGYLPHRREEWIARIGRIIPTAKGACWLPVNVDLGTGRVMLLPREWQGRVEDAILQGAGARPELLTRNRREEKWAWERRRPIGSPDEQVDQWGARWSLGLEDASFLFSGEAHRKVLCEAFENARQCVYIVSSFMRVGVLTELSADIKKALGRGVSVEILWGYNGVGEDSGAATLDMLKKLAYDCSSLPGRLRFNALAAGSHAKALLWDEGEGFRCCVGSYNWLSARYSATDELSRTAQLNASICISRSGFVAAVARTIGALWSRVKSERLGSSSERLGAIASELDRLEVGEKREDPGGYKVGLVRDLEHEGLLFAIMRSAKKNFFVTSHQLNQVGSMRLSPFIRKIGKVELGAIVAYGDTNMSGQDIVRTADNYGVEIIHVPGLHAKVCVGDNVSYVGSYNFLSADPYGTSSGTRELGVVISGADSPEHLLQWIRKQTQH